MASTVVFIAKECGICLNQSEVTLDTLVNADGVFFTNSLNGIWPLVALLPHTPKHPDYDATGLTHWAISPMTVRLQKALTVHLSQQVNMGDLC
jgi:branched-subunit amino acid aminotransferase/4-amino-4-deoxychorismate lyase